MAKASTRATAGETVGNTRAVRWSTRIAAGDHPGPSPPRSHPGTFARPRPGALHRACPAKRADRTAPWSAPRHGTRGYATCLPRGRGGPAFMALRPSPSRSVLRRCPSPSSRRRRSGIVPPLRAGAVFQVLGLPAFVFNVGFLLVREGDSDLVLLVVVVGQRALDLGRGEGPRLEVLEHSLDSVALGMKSHDVHDWPPACPHPPAHPSRGSAGPGQPVEGAARARSPPKPPSRATSRVGRITRADTGRGRWRCSPVPPARGGWSCSRWSKIARASPATLHPHRRGASGTWAAPSRTRTTLRPSTSCSTSVSPLGQRTSSVSARDAAPRPKCRRRSS